MREPRECMQNEVPRVWESNVTDIDPYKERRKEVLRELGVMQGEVSVSVIQAAQTATVNSKRLLVIFVLLLHSEPYKDEIHHIAHTIKWQAQPLLPYRIEAVVLDNASLDCDRPRRGSTNHGGTSRWRINAMVISSIGREEWRMCPIRNVNGDFDKWIQDILVDDFSPKRILGTGELLGGDDLDIQEMLGTLG